MDWACQRQKSASEQCVCTQVYTIYKCFVPKNKMLVCLFIVIVLLEIYFNIFDLKKQKQLELKMVKKHLLYLKLPKDRAKRIANTELEAVMQVEVHNYSTRSTVKG